VTGRPQRPEGLDPARLAALEEQLGRGSAEIAATLAAQLASALEVMSRALAADDLDEAGLAAHAARSSALMLDAEAMLDRLTELETAARGGDAAGARAAQGRLLEVWPALRAGLERAAGRG